MPSNLQAVDLCVVSRGIEHRTRTEAEVKVLVSEPAGTRNIGNIVEERFIAPNGMEIY
jgi:hypothetical protein